MFVCSLCVYMPYCMCGRSEGLWELVLFHCVSTGDETHQDYQKSLFLSSAISPAPKMSLKFLFFSITLNCKLVFLGFQWSDFTDRELAIHWAHRSLKCALSITLFPSEVYGPIPTLCPQFPQLHNTVVFRHSSLHNCLTFPRARKLQKWLYISARPPLLPLWEMCWAWSPMFS